ARIRDLRVPPRGALPRQLQMWLMVGIAVVIVVIILITGHPEPPERPRADARPVTPALAPTDRIRRFQQQLTEDAVRRALAPPQEALRAEAYRAVPAGAARPAGGAGPLTDDQRRREVDSLFADNVALSRRPPGQQPRAARASAPVPATAVPPPS